MNNQKESKQALSSTKGINNVTPNALTLVFFLHAIGILIILGALHD